MQLSRLKRIFERLTDSYAAAGAEEPAKDMRRVADLLKGHEQRTVDDFVAETRKALDAGGFTSAKQRSKINDDVVARHTSSLLSAGADRSAFDAAVGAIDADDQVGKLELFAIANRYRNQPSGGTHEIKFKSVKQARGTIRDVFLERADSQSKRGAIDKLTKRAS